MLRAQGTGHRAQGKIKTAKQPGIRNKK
jgi:hypothetical protein